MENLVRPATTEEIVIYERVDGILFNLDDEVFENLLEVLGHYVFSYGKERKNFYNRVARIAKTHHLTVKELETWYYLEG